MYDFDLGALTMSASMQAIESSSSYLVIRQCASGLPSLDQSWKRPALQLGPAAGTHCMRFAVFDKLNLTHNELLGAESST